MIAYADREWLTGGGDDPPALSFAPDGEISWRGSSLGWLPEAADPTAVAAGALLHVARDAAAAALERPSGTVDVVGTGLVAAHVRRLTGGRSNSGDHAPAVLVETTGDPGAIRSALDRVSDGGMVVLAGESSGRALDLDLYSSVHRRGLVVVGVPSPSESFDVAAWSDVGEDELGACRDALGSLWVRLEA